MDDGSDRSGEEEMIKGFDTLISEWATEDPFYERIFQGISDRRLIASLCSKASGWAAGIALAQRAAESLGLKSRWKKQSGEAVADGEEIGQFAGTPEQIVKFENLVIGLIAKPSGIASAARRAKRLAAGKIRLVSGGWKKQPFPIKEMIWEAVAAGGIAHRIVEEPFIYLDKNYVRIFGGISRTLQAVSSSSLVKVIQLRGEFSPIAEEAKQAINLGAQILMVDTGSWQDLEDVLEVLKKKKAPRQEKIAFAGGIKLEEIPPLAEKGVDILDIGAAILDAPWLELTYDVVKTS
jgi:nicotinate-nucleotide pyrophosphorylase (carboxylating)